MTNKIIQAASPPALANNARAGHPLFRNGKEEHPRVGHPPKLRLVKNGCEIVKDEPDFPRCYVKDPFGLIYNLTA